MVYIGMEGLMIIDTVFAKAVEKVVAEQGKDLRKMADDVLKLSSPDVSIREFRRVTKPDKQNRLRQLTLREAYEFCILLDKSMDEMIKIGMLL